MINYFKIFSTARAFQDNTEKKLRVAKYENEYLNVANRLIWAITAKLLVLAHSSALVETLHIRCVWQYRVKS